MRTRTDLEGFFKGRAVLVTGGAGFIGSHLVDALLTLGARVRVLDNLSTGHLDNLRHCLDRIEFLEGDIRDFKTCLAAVHGTACVFHQAAMASVPRSMEFPEATMEANVQGTTNLFAACRREGIAGVVYASSSSVYGDSETLPKREGEEGRLLSPYAYSKKADEDLAALFHACFGMHFIGLRYFNVFGPRQDPDGPYAAVLPRFFKACLSGLPPVIYGDGEQTRDFTYVGDVVTANLLAASAPDTSWNRVYNVAGGKSISVNRLAEVIMEAAGVRLAPIHEPARAGDVKHSLADIGLSERLLDFRSAFTFEQGIALSRESYSRMFAKDTSHS